MACFNSINLSLHNCVVNTNWVDTFGVLCDEVRHCYYNKRTVYTVNVENLMRTALCCDTTVWTIWLHSKVVNNCTKPGTYCVAAPN